MFPAGGVCGGGVGGNTSPNQHRLTILLKVWPTFCSRFTSVSCNFLLKKFAIEVWILYVYRLAFLSDTSSLTTLILPPLRP